MIVQSSQRLASVAVFSSTNLVSSPTQQGSQSQRHGILTSDDSLPAEACSSSGEVLLGSKAVSSTRAALSSEPLLLYSLGSGLSESLS
jgi:hypothetical protein